MIHVLITGIRQRGKLRRKLSWSVAVHLGVQRARNTGMKEGSAMSSLSIPSSPCCEHLEYRDKL